MPIGANPPSPQPTAHPVRHWANTDLMVQYDKHMATFLPTGVDYPNPHVPTDQDNADIIAYLKLL